jgi:8-oxo-dGTP pyrophosphatase MutT (NUDIX family)
MRNPWSTVGSRIVYENPWLRLREDSVVRPDGNPGIYGVVEMPPSVGVVAVNDADEVALVRQWRYTHGKVSVEVPTGGFLPSDKDIAGTAARELREETGLAAATMVSLGQVDNSNGVTTEVAHLFYATGLTAGEWHPDGTEDITLIWLPFKEVVRRVLGGAITESVSVAAVLKAQLLRAGGVL